MTRYKRVFPRLDDFAVRPEHGGFLATQVEASLDFTDAELIGAGSHSRVYRARFRLPIPLTARSSSGDVTVAAKTPLSDANSHRMLRHEAKMYSSAIPSYLTEEWTGYHFVSEAMYDGDGVVPVAAVVPKFYGFYVPEHWSYRGLLSPIMLLEECGTPIDREELWPKDREVLYSFVVRLQRAGVCHGSFKSANALQQPGPISAPPPERSLDTPSFRLIDFGRTEKREDVSEREWRALCREEMDDVKDEIYGRRKAMRDPVSGRKYTTRRFFRSSAGLV
ncbi:hypothetical protein CPB85DRAFT_1224568 [Mucidula mucida]|nr:hypothetical protein CPB85DRAFT_1224568 [Mucidula mucida]